MLTGFNEFSRYIGRYVMERSPTVEVVYCGTVVLIGGKRGFLHDLCSACVHIEFKNTDLKLTFSPNVDLDSTVAFVDYSDPGLFDAINSFVDRL